MSVSSQEICGAFFHVMRNMKAAFSMMAEERGLTLQQAGVLHVLYEGGVMFMGPVAEAMHCDASNITGIIDRLVTQGYVIRRESEHDRRAKQLILTEKGKTFIEHVIERAPSVIGCNKLNEREREELYGFLLRLSSQ